MHNLEELNVWVKSRDMARKMRKITRIFPTEEKYRLCDQLIRSSRSVSANIAEGFGRYHMQETIQFSRIAKGSLYETLNHLYVALDEGYITTDVFNDLRSEIEVINKMINGYIYYLKKAKNK
ncbi:four helix bundle protein [Balneola sp. MJW-20]|uniref:four helix bundle protein n=1 Tax=Gracilimonas aurantiaca TaxID=3234185 RepID=UPI0034666E12